MPAHVQQLNHGACPVRASTASIILWLQSYIGFLSEVMGTQVYKALLDGSVEVACKTLFAEDVITTASSIDQFAIELGILQTCSHPNIVHVFGAWMSYDLAYIVSELCGQGNLSKALVREHSAMRWYGR